MFQINLSLAGILSSGACRKFAQILVLELRNLSICKISKASSRIPGFEFCRQVVFNVGRKMFPTAASAVPADTSMFLPEASISGQ